MKSLISIVILALFLTILSKVAGFEIAVITSFCIVIDKLNSLTNKK